MEESTFKLTLIFNDLYKIIVIKVVQHWQKETQMNGTEQGSSEGATV